MFEPFTQADGSITRRFGGTGLGLTISRRFARALGGDIVAHSELGRGQRVHVTLDPGPLAGVRMLSREEAMARASDSRPAAASTWQFPPSAGAGGGRRRGEPRAGPLVLEEVGLTVEEAENGQVGVDKALQERFDVILMDMQMPVMDGYTATRTLRQRA